MNKRWIITGAGMIVLAAAAAAVASYTTRESLEPKSQSTATLAHRPQRQEHPRRMANAQPAQSACDDHNVVGTVAGGVGGGIVGSQIGRGNGKTAATIGGVLGGAYLGNRYIPTRNVTCQH